LALTGLVFCQSSDLEAEARELVAQLSLQVKESRLLSHDFLKCFADGKFQDMNDAVKQFVKEHYTYSSNFLDLLSSARDKLNPEDAEILTENMAEEAGHYHEEDLETLALYGIKRETIIDVPHSELLRRFLVKSGASDAVGDLQLDESIGGRFIRDMLEITSNTNACEAIAVIGFAVEDTAATLYRYIWDGIREHTVMNPDDYVFLPLHVLIDDEHSEHLKQAFTRAYIRNKADCINAAQLVRISVDREAQFFDELRVSVERNQTSMMCNLPSAAVHHTQTLCSAFYVPNSNQSHLNL